MPYLFCRTHGPEHEAESAAGGEEYRQAGETVRIVEGTLTCGPWLCDSCNAQLHPGDRAWLASPFPAHLRDSLRDYEYERDYFAMAEADRVASYGVDWPDDSLTRRRNPAAEPRLPRRIVSALALFRSK